MLHKLDIIIFGATGFTGKHLIPTIAKLSKSKKRNLTWGIAGRSEKKLLEVLKQSAEENTSLNISSTPIIIADVYNEESLIHMARQARVIINCCGPFRFFGESVIKACLNEGTHHIDVSGEIQYIEEMQLKYHKKAQEKAIYIISACGYESIPIDLGIVLLQEKFSGTLNSVEAYLSVWEEGNITEGSAFNYGTWESAIYVIAKSKELKQIRQKLFPNKLPKFEPKLGMKLLPRKTDMGWAFPFHAVDRPVVNRTQRLFYEKDSKRPVQVETYFTLKSFTSLVLMLIGSLFFLTLVKFSFGVKLLLKYPEAFSFGMFSLKPPNEERVKNTRFSIYLCGEGWKEKLPDANHQYTTPPNRTIRAKIEGPDPAYTSTSVCLAASAIALLTETNKLPASGGVYPPGFAFAKTSVLQELTENGIKIQVEKEKHL